ncbi:hypothetical protein [Halorubrum sp. Atlit-26R]|uniref:hypothetical protein n=1 Tax=Halorubrum sp. Atlit-26R TaxID=2282128 RepID=UPI001F3DA10D|nr:hypothetical protein [Halorubrum sp. Atlit-26R]
MADDRPRRGDVVLVEDVEGGAPPGATGLDAVGRRRVEVVVAPAQLGVDRQDY